MARIAIVGMGKFTGALMEGWLRTLPATDFVVCRRRVELLAMWSERGVKTTDDPSEAASRAQWLLLGVKPPQAEGVLQLLSPELVHLRGVVSVVAGLTQERLSGLCRGVPAFRVMPSVAASVGQSMTCIAQPLLPSDRLGEVEDLFRAIGQVAVVPEEMLDPCTVLASSGIAFALRFLRAMGAAGVEQGLGSELAYQLASQAMAGASALVQQRGQHPEQEVDRVTTPGGATIRGLLAMEKGGFSTSIADGVRTTSDYLRSLSK